jgi:hypothetical protein
VRTPFAIALIAVAVSGVSNTAFSKNACKVISPVQIAKLAGVSPTCTKAAPAPTLGATLYQGNWPGKSTQSPSLQLVVAVYTDGKALALATRNLKQGLPGPSHKVAGIGSSAYEGSGAYSVGVDFGVGKYIAYLTLSDAVGTPAPSPTVVEALAKSIVPSLR